MIAMFMLLFVVVVVYQLIHSPSPRYVKKGVPESQVAEHLLQEWLLPRIADQRAKIRKRLTTAPIDPKYERMSLSFDGCGPFLFRAVDFVKQGLHEELCLHFLKLCAGATGAASHGQENDRSPVFLSFKSTIHTEDRRYCVCPPDTHTHTHTHTQREREREKERERERKRDKHTTLNLPFVHMYTSYIHTTITHQYR